VAREELLDELDPLRFWVEFSSGLPHAELGKVKRTKMKEVTRLLKNFMSAGWFPFDDDRGRRISEWVRS
jgi:hypothetical protein